MKIVRGGLDDERVVVLLDEHLRGMADHSPPESIHALDHDGLRAAGVTFWTVWEGDALYGCGALQELDHEHGEIKSMRTAATQLRRGVATAMLEHIIGEAKRRGYKRLSLETGSGPGFDAAHALFAKYGFSYCGPFARYTNDPFSRFMTMELS